MLGDRTGFQNLESSWWVGVNPSLGVTIPLLFVIPGLGQLCRCLSPSLTPPQRWQLSEGCTRIRLVPWQASPRPTAWARLWVRAARAAENAPSSAHAQSLRAAPAPAGSLACDGSPGPPGAPCLGHCIARCWRGVLGTKPCAGTLGTAPCLHRYPGTAQGAGDGWDDVGMAPGSVEASGVCNCPSSRRNGALQP